MCWMWLLKQASEMKLSMTQQIWKIFYLRIMYNNNNKNKNHRDLWKVNLVETFVAYRKVVCQSVWERMWEGRGPSAVEPGLLLCNRCSACLGRLLTVIGAFLFMHRDERSHRSPSLKVKWAGWRRAFTLCSVWSRGSPIKSLWFVEFTEKLAKKVNAAHGIHRYLITGSLLFFFFFGFYHPHRYESEKLNGTFQHSVAQGKASEVCRNTNDF